LVNSDWHIIHQIIANNFPTGAAKRSQPNKPAYESHDKKHYFVLKMDKFVISMIQETDDNAIIAQSIEFMEKLQKKLNLTVLFANLGQ